MNMIMPSQITHLAVAKKFLEKHIGAIRDVQRFLDGSVMPDLSSDKAASHCGVRTEMKDSVKLNLEKVNPGKFVATHDMSDDFNKGQYLHLYTDDRYYNDFLLAYFQKEKSWDQIANDMYETTRRDDKYLRLKYGVEYADTSVAHELQVLNDGWDNECVKKRQQLGYYFVTPYDFVALDEFIDIVSNVNIPQN